MTTHDLGSARKPGLLSGVLTGPEVDVVGAERHARELAVGVGVLGGEPATGEHGRLALGGLEPRAATAKASGQEAGRSLPSSTRSRTCG
ncbi:MAG: hypothetical protein V9E81_13435 [Marmoricola sp.]